MSVDLHLTRDWGVWFSASLLLSFTVASAKHPVWLNQGELALYFVIATRTVDAHPQKGILMKGLCRKGKEFQRLRCL